MICMQQATLLQITQLPKAISKLALGLTQRPRLRPADRLIDVTRFVSHTCEAVNSLCPSRRVARQRYLPHVWAAVNIVRTETSIHNAKRGMHVYGEGRGGKTPRLVAR